MVSKVTQQFRPTYELACAHVTLKAELHIHIYEVTEFCYRMPSSNRLTISKTTIVFETALKIAIVEQP